MVPPLMDFMPLEKRPDLEAEEFTEKAPLKEPFWADVFSWDGWLQRTSQEKLCNDENKPLPKGKVVFGMAHSSPR